MPRPPLFPLLRAGAVLAFVGLLVCMPRRTAAPPAAYPGPVIYTVDIGQDAPRVVDLSPPAKPFPKQLTSCNPRVHTAINGGCWRRLADTPPCEEAYFWKGACYLPVMQAERTPTAFSP